MLKDENAVADAGCHGHPTFADVVVVVVDHDVEAEWFVMSDPANFRTLPTRLLLNFIIIIYKL